MPTRSPVPQNLRPRCGAHVRRIGVSSSRRSERRLRHRPAGRRARPSGVFLRRRSTRPLSANASYARHPPPPRQLFCCFTCPEQRRRRVLYAFRRKYPDDRSSRGADAQAAALSRAPRGANRSSRGRSPLSRPQPRRGAVVRRDRARDPRRCSGVRPHCRCQGRSRRAVLPAPRLSDIFGQGGAAVSAGGDGAEGGGEGSEPCPEGLARNPSVKPR